MRAYLNLRYTTDKRAQLFRSGLSRLGYKPVHELPPQDFKPNDIFVTWNRISVGDTWANTFARAGNKVIVVENASWGNEFAGDRWYHIALSYHNTKGMFSLGGPDRWDSLNVELKPFRHAINKSKLSAVILPQRGIGSSPVAMPSTWLIHKTRELNKKRILNSVRRHPGKRDKNDIEAALSHANTVYTWGSGAAIKALMLGCHVHADYKNWIGQQNNTEVERLAMLRRLAWAQWRHSEIESGEAFANLLRITL